MTKTTKLTLAVLPLLLTLACTDANKIPAEAAVKAGEAAVATLTDEVAQLAPDQVKAVREALANAKVAIAKQDFKTARTLAEPLVGKVKEAVAAANARKEALAKEAAEKAAAAKKEFDEGAGTITKELAALKKHVATLAKGKLPKGVTKDAAKAAKAAVAELEAGYAKAKAEVATDAAAALAKAKEVQEKAAELAASLKMKMKK